MFISIIFVAMIAIGTVSAIDDAADNATAVVEATNIDDTACIDNEDEILTAEVAENENVIEEADSEEILTSDDSSDAVALDENSEQVIGDSGTGGSGSKSSFNFTEMFGNATFTFGNGTSFNLSSLFSNGTFSLGNGTSFNISSLMNGTFSFGNGTSFNISSLLNSNSSSFDFSKIANLFGGNTNKDTIESKDLTTVFKPTIRFKATIKSGNETVTHGNVIFTINNKEYVGHIGSDGVAYVDLKNLKAGTHIIFIEYGETTVKNVITVKKATPKLTAAKKKFKAKAKTKKYTITLKTNTGAALKKAKVTLKIKGKTYKATTNAKGKATFKIKKLTKKGKYSATVKFAGNAYYNAAKKTVKIIVKK